VRDIADIREGEPHPSVGTAAGDLDHVDGDKPREDDNEGERSQRGTLPDCQLAGQPCQPALARVLSGTLRA